MVISIQYRHRSLVLVLILNKSEGGDGFKNKINHFMLFATSIENKNVGQ